MASNLDIQQYIPLKSVIAYFMDQYDKSGGDEDKFWLLGCRALALINQQFGALPKSVRLPVDGNKTVPFPADLISWSKIGIIDDNGQISSLKINRGLSFFRDNNPNRIAALAPDVNTSLGLLTGAAFFFNFYGNGAYTNIPFFGIGGGLQQFGECNVDEKNRVILLAPNFKYPDIALEYLSAPERDPDYMVETIFQEPIIAFLEWKMKLASRQEFYAACVEARRAMPGKRVTLQQLNQVVRETSGFYLKA